jgi:hypothetical protein
VYGVVISPTSAYAISDKGIISVGNMIEAFTVEKIEFDVVTLRNNDNIKDIRNVFVSNTTRLSQPWLQQGVQGR